MPGPGITETLATERAARVADLRYALSLTIPPDRTQPVAGSATITFTLRDAAAPLALDFQPNHIGALRSVAVGSTPIDTRLVDGHLILPAPSLRPGTNTISLDFLAGDAPLNRSDDFIYTLFVPARAHEAFPCFDQPDLKARWTLALDVPAGWDTLANGAEATRASIGDRTRLTFAETAPLSTYLVAFATGRFLVEQAERDGRAFRMLHRETDAHRVARNRDAIFDLHAAALDWLERYTGIPYPIRQIRLPARPVVSVRRHGASGRGVLRCRRRCCSTNPLPQNRPARRASTIAHETAHMWFGNLVTMTWFADVWMKEVFANFMAAKIVDPSFPAVNHDLRFLHANYPSAYDVDRTAGTNAIREPLDNLAEAGTLYGAIIYKKAPIVMRQLEALIGADAFRNGLANICWRTSSATPPGPISSPCSTGARPPISARGVTTWIEERGRPVIETTLAVVDGRISRLAFAMSDPDPRRGLTWNRDAAGGGGIRGRRAVSSPPASMALGPRSLKPSIFRRRCSSCLMALGIGYGEFHLDAQSLAWLSRHLPEIGDPLTRGSAWVTLWDSLLDRRASEQPLSRPRGWRASAGDRRAERPADPVRYLERAYWTFTSDADRRDRAPEVEGAMLAGLASRTPHAARKARTSHRCERSR